MYTIEGIVFLCYVFFHVALEFVYFGLAGSKIQSVFSEVSGKHKVELQFWPAGMLGFAVFFLAVWYFVVRDAVWRAASKNPIGESIRAVVLRATLLALGIYGVYNFTNRAVFHDAGYSWSMVAMDLSWGVFAVNVVGLMSWSAGYAFLSQPRESVLLGAEYPRQ